MSEQNTSLKVLRRLVVPDAREDVREVCLVRHSSGRFAEVARVRKGAGEVISLRPVRDLGQFMAVLDGAERRLAEDPPKRAG